MFRFLSGEMHEACTGSIISILLSVKVHETCTGSIVSILLSAKVHETCTGSIISIFQFFVLKVDLILSYTTNSCTDIFQSETPCFDINIPMAPGIHSISSQAIS